MPERIPQSVTIRVPLKAYLASDHVSPATGKTIAVVISKNGAAFGNPSGGATNATSIGNGWYYVDLSTTDTGTLGPLIVRGTEGTIDDTEAVYNVGNPHNAGFDGVPNAAAEASGGLYTRGTGAGQIKQTNNGEIDSNSTHVNNVATTSVTTVSANLGTTQPVNFTGTAGSAEVKCDTVALNGSAYNTPAIDVSGRMDLGKILGTASAGAAGYIGIDWGHVNASTTSVNLSGTTIATTQQVDVNTIKTQTVTCAAGVTVGAFVGNATHAITVDSSGRVQVQAGTSAGQISMTAGVVDVNAVELNGSAFNTPAIDVSGRVQIQVGTSSGQISATAGVPNVNVTQIAGSSTAATNQKYAALAVHVGSVTGAATTTTLNDSGLTQVDVDFWKGRVVIFVTGSLAGQASALTGYDGAGSLIFDALTGTPSGSDIYVIV